MKLFFDDAEMDGQLQRSLIAANSASADLGEVMATAARVKVGDYHSWFNEWALSARRNEERAAAALAAGRRVSARQAFLRATEYWRQAIFFIRHDLDDPRLQEGWKAHRAAFRAAIPLLDHDVVIGEIPFEGVPMTAYLCRAPGVSGPRPVVLAPCGIDSTAEAGYSATAFMAMKHGYDCVLWEGPGQGGTLYQHRLPMRPDFEAVLPAVVDWVLSQPEVDPTRIAIFGRSYAGYLAPRGVSGEPRIAALVCDPGQYEMESRVVGRLCDESSWKRIQACDPETEAEFERLLQDPHKREYFGARMATMGAKTVGDFLRMQPLYTVEGLASKIRCPVLLTEGENDFAGQSQALFEALTCDKHLVRFPGAEGAGGHCGGMGATLLEEVVFNWLDQVLPPGGRA